GLMPGVDIGPMTRASVADKCRAHAADALAKGATMLSRSRRIDEGPLFVAPTLLAGVNEQMRIAAEETFGPVLPIMPFDDEEEVIGRANQREMGLIAYVFSESVRRVTRASQALEFGMVAVNTASVTGPPIPFGGWKQSGLGREGSRHGILEFMEL